MSQYDIAIIGGGPAGLHAAWKAALLHRTCVVIDKGRRHSRIYWSPRVDNLPGQSPVSGRGLIEQAHADIHAYQEEFGQFVTIHEETEVVTVRKGERFEVEARNKDGAVTVSAKHLIVATGCVDAQPALKDFRRRDIEAVLPYANKGLADYCLLCDGHTVKGKRVAVLGCSPSVRGIAKSLKKNFGADTVLVPFCNLGEAGEGEADPRQAWADVEADLKKWDIPILYGHIERFTGIKDGQFGIEFDDGTEERFDKAWISMGWYKVNSEAAVQVGAATDEHGFVTTDDQGRMLDNDGDVVPGAYAIGDVRADSWKQIPVAWGQAEVAVIDCFVR